MLHLLGKPYEPAGYTPPTPRSPSPAAKDSPTKGKGKDKGKGAATPEPAQPTVSLLHVYRLHFVSSFKMFSSQMQHPSGLCSSRKFICIDLNLNTIKNCYLQSDDEMKEEEEEEAPVIPQEFQELSLTCPDGLSIKYALESSLGKNVPDRKVLIAHTCHKCYDF